MKKISLLLAATFISAPLAMMPAFAASDSVANHHTTANSSKPSGTITMTFRSADLGVGYTWGSGILKYQGKTYKFKVKGGNIVSVGYSKSQATGHVYNLHNIYDFAGSYASAAGEATAGVGVGAASMKNTKDVIISIDTDTMGARLAGAPGGLSITFESAAMQRAVKARDKAVDHTANKATRHSKNAKETTEDLNAQQLDQIKK